MSIFLVKFIILLFFLPLFTLMENNTIDGNYPRSVNEKLTRISSTVNMLMFITPVIHLFTGKYNTRAQNCHRIQN